MCRELRKKDQLTGRPYNYHTKSILHFCFNNSLSFQYYFFFFLLISFGILYSWNLCLKCFFGGVFFNFHEFVEYMLRIFFHKRMKIEKHSKHLNISCDIQAQFQFEIVVQGNGIYLSQNDYIFRRYLNERRTFKVRYL